LKIDESIEGDIDKFTYKSIMANEKNVNPSEKIAKEKYKLST